MATFQPNLEHIEQCLADVTAAVEQYRAEAASQTGQDARSRLTVHATRLMRAIRGPADLVFANFESVSRPEVRECSGYQRV